MHLPDNRNEIREEVDRTEYIEDCASGNQFREQRHSWVPKGPANDTKLLKKLFKRDLNGFDQRPLSLPRKSLRTNFHSARSFLWCNRSPGRPTVRRGDSFVQPYLSQLSPLIYHRLPRLPWTGQHPPRPGLEPIPRPS